jgi:hypothetical protein
MAFEAELIARHAEANDLPIPSMVSLISAMIIDSFTGGMFETNCFFLPEYGILVDAPQESADWLARQGHRVKLLLLTHGHVDHVWDGARIHREHGCPVGCHPETVQMVSEPEFFRRFGFALEIETFTPEDIVRGASVSFRMPGGLYLAAMSCSPAGWAGGICREEIRNSFSAGSGQSCFRWGMM